MFYYQFNLGDYASHTQHLSITEDLAYRRMLDYCYLNECGLPETVESIARVIRMQTHCTCIANVLREFFTQHSDGTYHNKRVDAEIEEYRAKSEQRKKAAQKRWENADANALQMQSKRNANHKPRTKNHKPITNIQTPRAERATVSVCDLVELGVSEGHARDWLTARKAKRLPLTRTALDGVISQGIDAGMPLSAVVGICAIEGWAGFKREWLKQAKPETRNFIEEHFGDRTWADGLFDGGGQ